MTLLLCLETKAQPKFAVPWLLNYSFHLTQCV